MPTDSVPEIDAIMQAGAAAAEKFQTDNKAIERAWAAAKLDALLDALKKRLDDDDSNDAIPGPIA